MNSLLAIVLVVNSTRGHHFMFSYPRNPQRPDSYYEDISTTLYSKNKNNNSKQQQQNTFKKHDETPTLTATTTATTSSTTDRLPPNASQSLRKSNGDDTPLDSKDHQQQQQQQPSQQQQKPEDLFAGRDSIFDIDVSFLADALAPRLELCDGKFQLSIDDLTFVGHPVSLTSVQEEDEEEDPEDNDQEETDEETTDESDDPHDNNTKETTTQKDRTDNNNSSKGNGGGDGHHSPGSNHSNDDNSNENVNNTTTTNSSTNTLKPKKRQGNDSSKNKNNNNNSNNNNNNKNNGTTHMTLFHVVFVMSPPDLELNARTDMIYSHVIRRYAAALQYEQLRCGYIQDEFEKILAIRDDAMNKSTPYDQVMQTILHESSLARDIKQIYAAISTNSIAHIIINDFIDLSLQIPVYGETVGVNPAEGGMGLPLARTQDYYYASLMDIYGMSGYEYDNYPTICPYHTLLLLEDPEEVLKNMPLDASPTLVQLVQILTPTQSLQELHLLLDCSLAQIYRLAAHLIYWRKAKLIHTIHARNIYVVAPQAKLDDLGSLNTDFKMHVAIPDLDLPRLLSQLSIAKPLHMIAPKEFRNQYLEAITYLVRKDLVIQLHMFLVIIGYNTNGGFMDDEDDSLSRRSSNSNANMPPINASPPTADNTTISSSPGQASGILEFSRNRFKRLVHDKVPKEIAELFERLNPYMDGKHHIEEIMYREGVSRRQLSLVLKYYRDSIVVVYHY
ncbi:nitrogen permease regulator of amino acid transport activity 3-domain-containing protein [Phascolomyces articulosus]|uniref:Nitrogen permease regulator 3 n=1 Tax=Phascolomyces articulosus TaxID=60185 RepID=A0AAD5PH11_9FUNG|nr:nitrogen permease regulator of amino acid transport activity 3-domain-containing protein [Phascolomyces articulosus]